MLPGAQQWTLNNDQIVRILERCPDLDGNATADGTKVELYDWNSTIGEEKWVPWANESLLTA